MGADLILYTCPHPQNLGLTVAEGKERLRRYALSVSRQELDSFFDDAGDYMDLESAYVEEVGDGPLEHLALMVDGEAPLDPQVAWGRNLLWDRLREAYEETVEGEGRRDVGEYRFGGLTFLLSGGVSWGDAPTEGGPLLQRLNWTGVFEVPGADGGLRTGVLNLSTAHVPPWKLEKNVEDLDVHWRCQAHDSGWIVFLGDPHGDGEAPDWFRPALRLARGLGCDLVNFDMDAEITDLIPDYSETA